MYSLYIDDQFVWSDIAGNIETSVLDPIVKKEIGKSGSMTFTLLPMHPKYGAIDKMKSTVRVMRDDKIFFEGRVVDNPIDFSNSMKVSCAGVLDYLNDTYIGPHGSTTTKLPVLIPDAYDRDGNVQVPEHWEIVDRPFDVQETPAEFFQFLINAHNEQCEIDEKKFVVGKVDVTDVSGKTTFKNNGFRNIRAAIDSDLVNKYKCFLQVRNVGGTRYIDLLDQFEAETDQPVVFAWNMLNLDEDTSIDDLVTVIVPIGRNNQTIKSVNNGSEELRIEPLFSRYGRITKIVSFSDQSDATKLLAEANKYISDNIQVGKYDREFTITAIDLSSYGYDYGPFDVGMIARIQSEHNNIDIKLVLKSAEFHLTEPEKNSYSFGDPKKKNKNSSVASSISNLASTQTIANDYLKQYIQVVDGGLQILGKAIGIVTTDIDISAGQVTYRNTNKLDMLFSALRIPADANDPEAQYGHIKEYLGEVHASTKGILASFSKTDTKYEGPLEIGVEKWMSDLTLTSEQFKVKIDHLIDDETFSSFVNVTAEGIQQVSSKVDEHGETLAQIDVQYDTIRQSIQRYGQTLTQIKETVDGIEMWNKDTEGNLGELVITAQGINERVQSVSGDVAMLKLSSDQFRVKLQSHDGSMSEIRQRQDEINQTVRDVDGNIGRLIVRADGITQRIATVGGQVSELKTTADGLNYRLSLAGEDLALFSINQEQILQQLKDTDGRISSIRVTLDGISAMTVDTSGRVGEMHSEFGLMKKNIAGLDGRLYDAEAGIKASITRTEVENELLKYAKTESVTSLASRVGDTEAGLNARVTMTEFGNRLKSYLTVDAASEIYIDDSKFNTKMGVYGVTDANGNSRTFAQILADEIRIDGVVKELNAKAITTDTLDANISKLDVVTTKVVKVDSNIWFASGSMSEWFYRPHDMTVDGVKIGKVLAAADVNFSVADTKICRDLVSAVTITTGDPTVTYTKSTNGYYVGIPYTMSNGKSGTFSHILFASEAFEAGMTEGGGTVVPGDIGLENFSWIDSTSTMDVSSYTTLTTIGNLIRTHRNGQGYVLFRANVKGATKNYKIPVG